MLHTRVPPPCFRHLARLKVSDIHKTIDEVLGNTSTRLKTNAPLEKKKL